MMYNTLIRWIVSLLPVIVIAITSGCGSTQGVVHNEEATRPVPAEPSNGDLRQRVLLVGDAGEPDCGVGNSPCNDAVLELLKVWAEKAPDKTFTLFLGDNIYEDGFPDASAGDLTQAQRKLEAQYQVLVDTESKGMFVPGNHDWDGAFGVHSAAWKRQVDFLKKIDADTKALSFSAVTAGCPWPAYITADLDGVAIIAMDTQWWLSRGDDIPASCLRNERNEQRVSEMLQAQLKVAQTGGGEKRDVIVASHHPLATHGPHGAWYRWFSQDIRGLRNRWMRKHIVDAYEESRHPPLIHAAGHDHALQVLEGANTGGNGYNLVSGAGSKEKINPVSKGDDTLFADSRTGFMAIDYLKDGSVWLRVLEPGKDQPVVYSKELRVAVAP